MAYSASSSKRPKGMSNPKLPSKPKKPSLVVAIGVGKPKKMADMKKPKARLK